MSRFIDLPFAYKVEGVPKGKRATVPRVFADIVTVELVPADDKSAQLVAIVDGKPFRRSEDGFLMPVAGPGGRGLSVEQFSALLGDKRKRRKWLAYPLRSADDGLPYCPFVVGKLTDDFRVSSSERDLRAGFARLLASRMRVIEGSIWEAVPEPCLAVYTKGLSVAGDVKIHVMCRLRHLMDAACFRLDDVAAAVEYAAALARKYGRRAPKFAASIEVVRPDLLSFDPHRAMAGIISFRLRPEQRERELSSFMLDKDPTRGKVAELFGAIDNYGNDPTAVLAAAHQLMSYSGRSTTADLVREALFPVLAGRLSSWAASAGADRALKDDEIAALSALALP
ncbi:hypothetical protein ACVIGB_000757 [Bradyrhizobium sp. USDA 4341]